jgi:hypothetical protein
MSTRYRWYQVRLPFALARLSTLLCEYQFKVGVDSGFLPDAGTTDGDRFRFFWRTLFAVSHFDEAGNQTFETVETINVIVFSLLLRGDCLYLRLEDPGRQVRELLNALERIAGLGFVAEPVTFERFRPRDVFRDVGVATVVGLKVVGAVLAKDIVARIEYASKDGIDVERVPLLDKMKYRVEAASFSVVSQGVRGHVALSSNGSAKVSGQLAPLLLQLIEAQLPKRT